MKVEFFRHNLNEADIANVTDVLKSTFLTTGDVTKDFEEKLSFYAASRNTIAVTSCTAALQLSLIAWGIGEGDEVITTPMSFCATANSILHVGAKPVFVDVEEATGNIDTDLIEEKITSRTKAIIPVHLYGQMCDMKSLRNIANNHGLIIIEDAAHCIEGERDGIRVGHLGDAACYSFYATKNITSGEGGAVITNDDAKAEQIRMLRLHGIDKSAVDRYTKKYQHWDMPILGWKYNMDNIHAALLVDQIKRIDEYWQRRETIWRIYEEKLSSIKDIDILKTLPSLRHARHLFTILVKPKERDLILWALQEKGIGVAVNYRPIHLLKYYKQAFGYRDGRYPIAEKIGKSTLSLPLYPSLTDEEIDYVVNNVIEIVNEGYALNEKQNL